MMRSSIVRLLNAAAIVTVMLLLPQLHAQQSAAAGVTVLHVQGSVSLIATASRNVAVQVGKNGVVVVDTPAESLVPQVMAEIRKLSRGPVRYIVNTSIDTTSGNASLVGPAASRGLPFGFAGLARPSIIAHETVLNRMSVPPAGQPAAPAAAWPTTEYFQPTMDFYANDEPIVLYHQPAAHTDGDTVVLFRRSDVIAAGDVFTPGRYPVIDLQRGGSVQGLISALTRILQLAVPEAFEEGGTKIIPGRGHVSEETDVAEFRDMLVIVRDRIQDSIDKGMTLDQIKTSRPSRDYDREYGATQSDADRYVETIYRSLSAKPGGKS
jgi:glyoxylase-like metal-dependent hydrolase (beta-lactamase superfamily II)